MTDKTATQNLTRTTSGDDPENMATYLGTLAGEVDQRMRSHYYDLGRSREIPAAVVRITEEILWDTTVPGRLPYDTVMLDTAALVDFSVSNQRILLRETGWWCVGVYVHCTGFGVAASDTQVQVSAANVSWYGNVRDGAIGLAAASASTLVQVTTANTETVNSNIFFNGGSLSNVTTIRFAEMWAYKVRDL